MFELNDTKKILVAERYSIQFLWIRYLAIFVACGVSTLLVSQISLLSFEAFALQQKMTELRQDIARAHRGSIHEIEEVKCEWAGYAIEIDRVARVLAARSGWGDKLGLLSEIVPQGLCFDFISGSVLPSDESKSRMTLETVVVAKADQGKELVLNFMELLKKEKKYGEKIAVNYEEWITIGVKDLPLFQIRIEVS